MNKSKAKEEAMNNSRTWGELLRIVEDSDLTGMSKVNKALTRVQTANIFKNMIAENDLNEVPVGKRYNSHKERTVISGGGLGIQNLLREFA